MIEDRNLGGKDVTEAPQAQNPTTPEDLSNVLKSKDPKIENFISENNITDPNVIEVIRNFITIYGNLKNDHIRNEKLIGSELD